MDDTKDPDYGPENPGDPDREKYNPPAWLSTDAFEAEVFNAIVESVPARDPNAEGYGDFDEDLVELEEYESEEEQRCSALRVLATLKPDLADLLGAPSAR